MATFENDTVSQTTPPLDSREVEWKESFARQAAALLTWEGLAWFTLLVSAVLTRLWNLGARVVSHDESMHVYFSWLLSQGSGYNHNPMMHGPLLYELTALFQSIFPVTDFTSRLAPALLGILLVVVIPLLLRPWLGRWGALVTSLFLLISPYILYFSRYNRHDIYEIFWALLATYAILAYLRERRPLAESAVDAGLRTPAEEADPAAGEIPGEPLALETLEPPDADGSIPPLATPAATGPERSALETAAAPLAGESQRAQGEHWLLFLAGLVGLMFSSMETAFFYLAIFASFLLIRILALHGLRWERIKRSAEFDLLIVLVTLGAFFSSQITLLVLNPIWSAVTGEPFVPLESLSAFGIEWSSGPYGVRIWGLMIVFWWAAAVVGILWDWRRWWKLAAIFLAVTITLFTTFFTNWSGVGTGFVGSLGYWLSQHGVERGSQPWYYYLIVFPIYEYLPILGGLAALFYIGLRNRILSETTRLFGLYAAWWAVWIFAGLTIAGEKMPWLSTHITTPFILLAGWFVGQMIQRSQSRPAGEPAGQAGRISRPLAIAAVLPFVLLAVLTARTAYQASYVNYDSVVEFIDYAHGGPGVKWLVADVEKIGASLGQANPLPVAFDSANAWPLTWYLRNRSGFYGEQPDRSVLLSHTVVVAGQQNWQKVERFLGADYSRYEVNRIWWPMEEYKNLTWERVRGALTDPQMRQAVWDILWARDYRQYANLTGQNLDPPWQWPLQDRMRVYIRKDAAAQQPDLKLKASQIEDIVVRPDPYLSMQVSLEPLKLIQPGDFNGQRNLALAPDGTVYVADTGNSRIVRLDPEGSVLSRWGSRTPENQTPPAAGTFNEPWGVAVDGQGNVYVADTWNHRIQKFDAQGTFLLEWGGGGLSSEDSNLFWGPRGIVIGPGGNVYITDTGNRRVAVFDAQGNFQFEFARDGNAQLNEPVGIAIDAQERVFVADAWNMRVAIFNAQGNLERSFPVEAWNSTSIDEKPFIALDRSGRVYLTDPEAGRVLVFNSNGIPQAMFGQPGIQDNTLDLPTGLASDLHGNIWIADAGNNRLVVYPELE